MLSGMYDANAITDNPELCTREDYNNFGGGPTNCCHILSEFTLQDAGLKNLGHDREVGFLSHSDARNN